MEPWEIMNIFKAEQAAVLLANLQNTHGLAGYPISHGRGAEVLASDDPIRQRVRDGLLDHVIRIATEIGAPDTARQSGLVKGLFEDPKLNAFQVQSNIDRVSETFVCELRERRFVFVAPDRNEYLVDQNASPFGIEVERAFPSAARDICEAANCVAMECTTAAVFHALRAAEVVLRVLAHDRGVTYPDASLESKQVGDLLGQLDTKLANLRKADGKNWPSRDVKGAQIQFYHSAVAEFRDFNEAWRKHMAHAHEGAFYDRDQAVNIMNHAKGLMGTLCKKLSEGARTPEFWTDK